MVRKLKKKLISEKLINTRAMKTNENERTNSLHKIMIFQIKSVVACVLFL